MNYDKFDVAKQRTALHEAGHVVVANAMGARVSRVELLSAGGYSGRALLQNSNLVGNTRRTHAAMLLAGAAAEGMIGGGPIRWDGTSATVDIRDAAWLMAWQRPDPRDPNWIRSLMRIERFNSAACLAIELVQANSEPIEVLAAELLERTSLDAEAIHSVVARFGFSNRSAVREPLKAKALPPVRSVAKQWRARPFIKMSEHAREAEIVRVLAAHRAVTGKIDADAVYLAVVGAWRA